METAILSKPSVLAQADGAVVDRVIGWFPNQSKVLTQFANALEPLNPEHSRRLRMAAATRTE